jgi:hypothetical protein
MPSALTATEAPTGPSFSPASNAVWKSPWWRARHAALRLLRELFLRGQPRAAGDVAGILAAGSDDRADLPGAAAGGAQTRRQAATGETDAADQGQPQVARSDFEGGLRGVRHDGFRNECDASVAMTTACRASVEQSH